MIQHTIRWFLVLVCTMVQGTQADDQTKYQFGGHLKTQGTVQTFPDDSVINGLTGSSARDLNMELRLLFSADQGSWDFKTDGQAIILHGDTVEYTRELLDLAPGYELLFGRLPNDDRRWWNLTGSSEDENKTAVIGRLDRLSVGYTGKNTSVRFGRQAISWGNGLVYAPMDIVNPFDPSQIDTEYKTGDDMLYGQYLRGNGDDIQATYVVRRNPQTGNTESDQATLAGKYHGFAGATEFDLMAARHYGEAVIAVGGSRDLGGAVWRADLVLSATDEEDPVAQFVVNTSYSWTWSGRNISGNAEYFFNGFGQHDGCYSPDCLADNPELVERIGRRQIYTLGRHYLSGNLMIEMTPLFTLTPQIFWNTGDGSALLQVVTQNSLGDNLVLLGALSVPMGPDGTEYGGIETGVPGAYYSSDLTLFLQLGWYF
jgi:hypothetical protein